MAFFFASHACQTRHWAPAGEAGDCDLTTQTSIRNAARWNQNNALPGCLRISWGTTNEQHTSLYVQLDKNGQMTAYNPVTQGFGAPITYNVPPSASNAERSFVFFAFGNAVTDPQTTCTNMNAPGYTCARSETAECWFSMQFQPTPTTQGLTASTITERCLLTPPLTEPRPEPKTEPKTEPHNEPEPKTEPEPTREANPEPKFEIHTQEKPDTNEPKSEPERQRESQPDSINAVWTIKAGANSHDRANGIHTTQSGDVYVTGFVQGNIQFGHIQKATTTSNAFAWQLDKDGTTKQVHQTKGTGQQQSALGYNIQVVEQTEEIYVMGYFRGTTTFGSTTLKSKGTYDTFVWKLDRTGKTLWVVQAGHSNYTQGNKLKLDTQGNVYVSGTLQTKADFGNNVTLSTTTTDVFVWKLNSSGKTVWARQANAEASIHHNFGLGVSSTGNVYVTGNFKGQATFGGKSLQTGSAGNIFVWKLNTNGDTEWAIKNSAPSFVYGQAVAIDTKGHIYVVGYFKNDIHFVVPPHPPSILTATGGADAFVWKLDEKGNTIWGRIATSTGLTVGTQIDISPQGHLYVTGYFRGNMRLGTITFTNRGSDDIFVWKLDQTGNTLWAKQAGGNSQDQAYGIAATGGYIYVTGTFMGMAHFGGSTLQSNGQTDIFVWRSKDAP